MISKKNVLISVFKILIKSFTLFLFFYFSCSFASSQELNFSFKKIQNFSFNKSKFYFSNDSKEMCIFEENTIYKKSFNNLEKIFKFEEKSFFDSIIFNDFYVVAFNLDKIIVIDINNKVILWEKKFNENIYCKPIISGNFLFINLGFDKIAGLDILNGNIVWYTNLDIKNSGIYTNSKLLHSKYFLYYITANHKVTVIEKKLGALLCEFSIRSKEDFFLNENLFINNVKIYNNFLYISYNNGDIFAFDCSEGLLVWNKYNFDCKKILAYRNFLFVIRLDGSIVLINRFDGNEIKNFLNFKYLNVKKMINFGDYFFVFYNNSISNFLFKKYNFVENNIIKDKVTRFKKTNSSFVFYLFAKKKIYEFVRIR